jgi:acyl dehydratase
MTDIPAEALAMIGTRKVRRCQVTRRDIERFAQAIGETDGAHCDEAVAGGSSDESIVAPPLFCQTLAYEDVAVEELPPDRSPIELNVPIPARRTVGGSSEYIIHRRVRPGDVLTTATELKNLYVKEGKSGPLYFVVVETRVEDQRGEPVATETATYIKRI